MPAFLLLQPLLCLAGTLSPLLLLLLMNAACWGYPGGKPTCYGGKAKWNVGCGGTGYCYKSRTYAKNCGSRCNLYWCVHSQSI
jgi:hypothetical protein